MASTKTASKGRGTTKRGSPEAIAKRRAARALNRMFDEGGNDAAMDGRTLKRKKRLITELKGGRAGKPLKAQEVLAHVTELLSLGETLTTLRKMKPRVPPAPRKSEETVAIVRETQATYGFDPRAWKILGIDLNKWLDEGKPARSRSSARAARGRRKSRA